MHLAFLFRLPLSNSKIHQCRGNSSAMAGVCHAFALAWNYDARRGRVMAARVVVCIVVTAVYSSRAPRRFESGGRIVASHGASQCSRLARVVLGAV